MNNENKKKEPEIIVTNNIGDIDISKILTEIISNYIAEKIKKSDVPLNIKVRRQNYADEKG